MNHHVIGTRKLDHPIICWCRKHRQLAHYEGEFAVCFPPDVPMVYSPKLTFIANGNNPTGIGLAPGETIYFGSLEFTTDHFGRLSLSPNVEDSGAIFVGMVHSGSSSLHTALEELSDEGNATSGKGGSSGLPDP
jgi:hypothetical protein